MAEALTLGFASPTGGQLAFEWSPKALAGLDPEGPEPAWSLVGELDWSALDRVRLVSARIGEERGLVVAAIRPAGAAGHGEETVAGLLVAGDEAERLDEVLLSVEHGADERVLRVGLELYRSNSPLPVRIAADATGLDARVEGDARRERTALAVRAAEGEGVGTYEVLRAA